MTPLQRKLLDQYNSQNDTQKPGLTEEYNYQLTEAQFDLIQKALGLLAATTACPLLQKERK